MNYSMHVNVKDAVICGIGVPVVFEPYKFTPRLIDELFTIQSTHALFVGDLEYSLIISSSVIHII
jgi:hypothetical protein